MTATQPVLPSLTRMGRVHQAVETVGLLPHSIYTDPSMYVRTRCGIASLGPCTPYRRDGGFPDCRRCYPPARGVQNHE